MESIVNVRDSLHMNDNISFSLLIRFWKYVHFRRFQEYCPVSATFHLFAEFLIYTPKLNIFRTFNRKIFKVRFILLWPQKKLKQVVWWSKKTSIRCCIFLFFHCYMKILENRKLRGSTDWFSKRTITQLIPVKLMTKHEKAQTQKSIKLPQHDKWNSKIIGA